VRKEVGRFIEAVNNIGSGTNNILFMERDGQRVG
jgi:hypothetical protein